MAEDSNEEIPGISIAILFGFIALLAPLVPAYFNSTNPTALIVSFVIAGIALLIGIIGAALELRQLGFFSGIHWENAGFALGFAVFAGILQLVTVRVSAPWLQITLKIVILVVGLLALLFLAAALAQALVEQKQKRDQGSETASSRRKAVGASAVFLITLLTAMVGLVTQVLEFLNKVK